MNRRANRQRGVALLEMVGMLIVAVPLLAALVVYGRLTWHIVVMEKSAASASRIVNALPPESFAVDTGSVDLKTLVYAHVKDAFDAAGVATVPKAEDIIVTCGDFACSWIAPASVSVAMTSIFQDTVFYGTYTGPFGLPAELAVYNKYEQGYVLPVYPVKALPAP